MAVQNIRNSVNLRKILFPEITIILHYKIYIYQFKPC